MRYPRCLEEKDYTRVVIGVTSWWLSTVKAPLQPELIEHLCKSIMRGNSTRHSGEVNVLKSIGETRINRFYARHNMIPDLEDTCGFGCWVNVFDRDGNHMIEATKSLTEHLGQVLRG
jgi:hypothetical protein